MSNADKPRFTVTQSRPGYFSGNVYIVVSNDAGQYAIWPGGPAIPAGWRARSGPLPLSACRALVAQAWPDIIPAGLTFAGGTAAGVSPAGLVAGGFAATAARDPDAVAVRGAVRLRYAQRQRSSGQLAHALRDLGVGPETVVGSGLERGGDSIRALLALLAAGGAYLPLDPALPAARLAPQAAGAGAAVILTHRAAEEAFAETKARLVFLDELPLDHYPATDPDVGVRPENVA